MGETFTITKMNVERIKQEERLFCKSCASPVMIKAGQIKIPHFAHEKTMKCAFASEGESEEHLAAKNKSWPGIAIKVFLWKWKVIFQK